MFRFFRSVRQSLLQEGKLKRYLAYALGEVVLVVFGIFLALQLNNWNEDRKAKGEVTGIKAAMHAEYLENRLRLDFVVGRVDTAIIASKELMALVGSEDALLESRNVDSILYRSLEFARYSPTNSVFEDMVQSGRLDRLAGNDSLKTVLYRTQTLLSVTEDAYSIIISKENESLLPYLQTRYPMRDMDQYGLLSWETPSRMAPDKYAMFRELQFENILDDYIYSLTNYRVFLGYQERLIAYILRYTETEKPPLPEPSEP